MLIDLSYLNANGKFNLATRVGYVACSLNSSKSFNAKFFFCDQKSKMAFSQDIKMLWDFMGFFCIFSETLVLIEIKQYMNDYLMILLNLFYVFQLKIQDG